MECGCGKITIPLFIFIFLLVSNHSNHLYFLFFLSLNIIGHSMKRREVEGGEKECDMHVILQTLCSPLPPTYIATNYLPLLQLIPQTNFKFIHIAVS
jgi:hypothetical protein